ncbi:hypothetical protein [Deinococcus sp. RM]|uniref:hypothetical protein n=1 Tax=Deinococcus sp. RM TaxID=2316359 RepID=UPI0013147A12|nr:hypothetical protein [Deinococcus sp. RM]
MVTFDPTLLLMYPLAGLLAVTAHEFAHVLLPLRAGACACSSAWTGAGLLRGSGWGG